MTKKVVDGCQISNKVHNFEGYFEALLWISLLFSDRINTWGAVDDDREQAEGVSRQPATDHIADTAQWLTTPTTTPTTGTVYIIQCMYRPSWCNHFSHGIFMSSPVYSFSCLYWVMNVWNYNVVCSSRGGGTREGPARPGWEGITWVVLFFHNTFCTSTILTENFYTKGVL